MERNIFKADNDYLLDPFLRPPICCLVLSLLTFSLSVLSTQVLIFKVSFYCFTQIKSFFFQNKVGFLKNLNNPIKT